MEMIGNTAFGSGAYGRGGSFYLNGATATFAGAQMSFENNIALLGGALYASGGASVTFAGESMRFMGNTASSGAVLYAAGNSKILFTGANADLLFEANRSMTGKGVIALESGSEVKFEGLNSFTVYDNFAQDGGGFLYISNVPNYALGADIIHISSNISPSSGGAMYLSGSKLNFASKAAGQSSKKVSFIGNISGRSGGALFTAGSTVIFDAGMMEFIGNTAVAGSVLYASEGSSIVFTRSSITIADNLSQNGNGAISWNASQVFFTNLWTLNAAGNSSLSGGFLYLVNSIFKLDSQTINISGNEARDGSGGAIYFSGSTMAFDATPAINDNVASSSGGAVYLANGSSLTFNNKDNKPVQEFARNSSAWSGGALFVDLRSTLTFNNVHKISALYNIAGSGDAESEMIYTEGNGGFAYFEGSSYVFNTARKLRIIGNTAFGSGGGIYLKRSTLVFEWEAPEIQDSIAYTSGGNIYVGDHSVLEFRYISTLTFSGGRAVYGGGGMFFIDETSVLRFTEIDNLIAKRNRGAQGGFLYLENQRYDFTNTRLELTSNTATIGSGGALYLDRSTIIFTAQSDIKPAFLYNTAASSGGAVYIGNGSSVSFSGYDFMEFRDNVALNGGGGVFFVSRSSFAMFDIKEIFAHDNKAYEGGFVYFEDYQFSFNDMNFDVRNNVAGKDGGVFYLKRSTVTLDAYYTDSSKYYFINNTAFNNGSVIYVGGGSSMTIMARELDFINNTAVNGNGTLYAEPDSYIYLTRTTTITAVGNRAANGGVFYLNGNAPMEINAKMEMTHNVAFEGYGGAIYTSGTNITIHSDRGWGETSFADNSAHKNGGAIYIAGGANVRINVQSDNMYFVRNRTGLGFTQPNDVYIDSGTLHLNVQGERVLVMDGGIITKEEASVKKDNIGNLLLGGKIDIQGTFDVYLGSVTINLKEDDPDRIIISQLNVRNPGHNLNVEIAGSGVWTVKRGSKIHNTTVDKANIAGILGVGVDFFNLSADSLQTSDKAGASIDLDLNSILRLVPFAFIPSDAEIWIVRNSTYTGQFSNFDEEGYSVEDIYGVNNPFPTIAKIEYDRDKGDIKLKMTTKYDFEGKIDNLSHNQMETAKAFDTLKDVITMYSLLDPLSNNIYDDYLNGDYTRTKELFDRISGRFLVNVLTLGTISNVETVYTKIKEAQSPQEYEGVLQSIWVQTDIQGYNFKEEGATGGEFSVFGGGLQAGFPLWRGKHNLGIFIGYDNKSIKQDLDKANMHDIQVGIYGGRFGYGDSGNVNFKGDLSFGVQAFSTQRDIGLSGFNANPKAEFNTYSIRYGFEAEYVLSEKRDNSRVLKPYIGAHGGTVFNGEIKEDFGQAANLVIDGNAYTRLNGAIGFRLEDLTDAVNWQIKAYLGYLLMGTEPRYDISFQHIDREMDIIGTKQDGLNGGAAFWLDFKINKDLSLFTNMNISFGENMFGYYANVGINYKIEGRIADVKAVEESIRDRRKSGRLRAQEGASAQEEQSPSKIDIEAVELQSAKSFQDEDAINPDAYIEKYETDLEIESDDIISEIPAGTRTESAASPAVFSSNVETAQEKSFRMLICSYDPDQKEYELTPELRAALRKLAQDIRSYKYIRVFLIANGGSKEMGQLLASMRMDAILEYLYIRGIDIDKMETVDLSIKSLQGINPDTVSKDTVEVVVDYLE
jgi:predicted outer membrane repeat protein